MRAASTSADWIVSQCLTYALIDWLTDWLHNCNNKSNGIIIIQKKNANYEIANTVMTMMMMMAMLVDFWRHYSVRILLSQIDPSIYIFLKFFTICLLMHCPIYRLEQYKNKKAIRIKAHTHTQNEEVKPTQFQLMQYKHNLLKLFRFFSLWRNQINLIHIHMRK